MPYVAYEPGDVLRIKAHVPPRGDTRSRSALRRSGSASRCRGTTYSTTRANASTSRISRILPVSAWNWACNGASLYTLTSTGMASLVISRVTVSIVDPRLCSISQALFDLPGPFESGLGQVEGYV